jgi:gluconolactonase
MKSKRMLIIAIGAIVAARGQAPPAPRTGPGVQAPQDAKEPEVLAGCKTPPPGRGAGRGPARGAAPAPAAARDYTVTEIPGVIAAGQQWKEIWTATGNNADGMIGTKDGGLMIAQNNNSDVLKIDKDGKASVAYKGTNTGGALSMNSKGVLFVNNRGLNASIEELAPQRKTFANKYKGDSFDCIGGVLNDLAAAGNGGVYFTMGGLFYANPKGEVTSYGENLFTNGIILSRDEKTLWVTNRNTLAAFDVQPDGSLTNQREFTKWEGGGGDGSTIDSEGRIYVSTNQGVRVIAPDGKYLGLIPTRRDIITLAFSGKDKKTLYAVEWDAVQQMDWIVGIQMTAQGYKGRAK